MQFLDVHDILNTADNEKGIKNYIFILLIFCILIFYYLFYAENTNPNVQSLLPSCSDSSTSSNVTSVNNKRRKSAVSNETCEANNNFWAIASKSIQSIQENEKTDSLKYADAVWHIPLS